MFFYEEDEGEVFAFCESNLEGKKKDKNDRNTPCYAILATPHQNESNVYTALSVATIATTMTMKWRPRATTSTTFFMT